MQRLRMQRIGAMLECDRMISKQIAKRWAICEEIRLKPDMNPEVEFLFGYRSPFSYLANLQIEKFAKCNGAAVTYTPILLGAVKATGNASPMTVPAKGRYMAIELRRWAARYGVAFKPDPHGFMSNTLRLMRGAIAAQANGWFALYYRATWAEAESLRDDTVLRELLENVGVPATTLMAGIERRKVKDRLRQKTDRRRWSLFYAGERSFGVVPAS